MQQSWTSCKGSIDSFFFLITPTHTPAGAGCQDGTKQEARMIWVEVDNKTMWLAENTVLKVSARKNSGFNDTAMTNIQRFSCNF